MAARTANGDVQIAHASADGLLTLMFVAGGAVALGAIQVSGAIAHRPRPGSLTVIDAAAGGCVALDASAGAAEASDRRCGSALTMETT